MKNAFERKEWVVCVKNVCMPELVGKVGRIKKRNTDFTEEAYEVEFEGMPEYPKVCLLSELGKLA